jgi:hypothetical protein
MRGVNWLNSGPGWKLPSAFHLVDVHACSSRQVEACPQQYYAASLYWPKINLKLMLIHNPETPPAAAG